jgi:hypothetical protein
MSKARRFLVALVLPAVILVGFTATAFGVGHAGKADVCHWANHKYVHISVSNNAVPAHLSHGDVLVDEYGDCPA